MMPKYYLFLYVSLLIWWFRFPMKPKQIVIGGLKPIRDLEDPYMVIAKLVVIDHNKHTNKNLDFIVVVKGEDATVTSYFTSW